MKVSALSRISGISPRVFGLVSTSSVRCSRVSRVFFSRHARVLPQLELERAFIR